MPSGIPPIPIASYRYHTVLVIWRWSMLVVIVINYVDPSGDGYLCDTLDHGMGIHQSLRLPRLPRLSSTLPRLYLSKTLPMYD